MFETFLSPDGSRRRRAGKAMTYSLSLIFPRRNDRRIIVVPLLRAEAQLPGFKVIDAALLFSPIVPGVPPGPGSSGQACGRPAGPEHGPKDPPPAARPRGFMAPVEIPTEIIDENRG